MSTAEDAASNQRLIEALFGSLVEAEAQLEKDRAISSHQQLDYDEDGVPTMLRFAYVDEQECIGCTYCADVARNTFFMEDDAGRARVFAQGGDDPDTVLEAIDCCPVNCISFVDLEDLIILETERDGIVINQRSAGLKHADSSMNRREPTKAKFSGGTMCCNNCPSKGCKSCPMYGVGLNPVFIARKEEREARREASGAAVRSLEEEAKANKVAALFSELPLDVEQPHNESRAQEGNDFVGVVEPHFVLGDDTERAGFGCDMSTLELAALFADDFGVPGHLP
eukprot:CAMPEP_0183354742 /NCGR_PEP_ID=MMETSP0164_2-20130417/38004_1 /TAXON_ID=221442 /ORGANISM="Coccolithus pelagicus ssp braarudi, Strain PLY182g" /LENGTH=281 /DNA_ID=CAMNT_0025527685 /DNA_START=208 /DNA_END=1053 /DNA_ORIENTATION=+